MNENLINKYAIEPDIIEGEMHNFLDQRVGCHVI